MKNLFVFIFAGVLAIALFSKAKSLKSTEKVVVKLGIDYPEEVKSIIDNKCYKCHSDEGKSDDAKNALLWDKLPNLKLSEQIGTLDEIVEVLEEGTMPPKKIIEKYPSMKLSDKEKKVLLGWAEKTADNLIE